jgi:hypothetical protein
MSIPRFSPIDDDAQVLNEDEYEAGYQSVSCSATAAMMWTTNRFAWGMSTETKHSASPLRLFLRR